MNLSVTTQRNFALGQGMCPKLPQPEPQDQEYNVLKRSGNVSKCNGSANDFDKSDKELCVLARFEMDWYIYVDKIQGYKTYRTTKRNFYYCIARRCILLRRPLVNISTIKIAGNISDVGDTVVNRV